MHQDWNTQNIVITGAASGLGQAICARFTRLGAAVRGIDVNQASLRAIQTDLGKNFVPLICDVTIWEEVAHTFQQLPPVDVLVNCAGITGKTDLRSDETDPADVERVFRVNFFGSYHTSKAILPRMAERGYGRLLHVASIAGKEGNAGMLAYSASKAAVIATAMVDAMPERQVRYMTDKIPMGRCGSLDEVVAMVEFIVSPGCSFTTGFTFDLTGGRATY